MSMESIEIKYSAPPHNVTSSSQAYRSTASSVFIFFASFKPMFNSMLWQITATDTLMPFHPFYPRKYPSG
jgi:hypothetical protein